MIEKIRITTTYSVLPHPSRVQGICKQLFKKALQITEEFVLATEIYFSRFREYSLRK